MEEWEDELQRNPANKQDMNALVMNYFVTEGYVEAAEQFQQESGTAPGVDLATITDRMVIRQAVQGGQIEEAIDKVNDLNPEILEHQRELYFHLQQQRLIELIKLGDADGALTFAQVRRRRRPSVGEGTRRLTGARRDAGVPGAVRRGEPGVPRGAGAHGGAARLRPPGGVPVRGPLQPLPPERHRQRAQRRAARLPVPGEGTPPAPPPQGANPDAARRP